MVLPFSKSGYWLNKLAVGNKSVKYPIATVSFYGTDKEKATKVVVGIVPDPASGVQELKKWFANEGEDLFRTERVLSEVLQFIREKNIGSVAMADGLMGCPHEEVIDYPRGTDCPQCPAWVGSRNQGDSQSEDDLTESSENIVDAHEYSDKENRNFFQIKVSLCDAEPEVWRRFLISDTASFATLHKAIQDACEWENSHLYSFFRDPSFQDEICTSPIERGEFSEPAPDARNVKLKAFLRKEKLPVVIYYLYDFGDGWQHKIEIEKTVQMQLSTRRKLLSGARSFPKEDMGGMGRYEFAVDVLNGSANVEKREAREFICWLDGWDPEKFDLERRRHIFER